MDEIWAPDTIFHPADAASGILVFAFSDVTAPGTRLAILRICGWRPYATMTPSRRNLSRFLGRCACSILFNLVQSGSVETYVTGRLEAQWQHDERGPRSLGDMLRLVLGHDHLHFDQITRYIQAVLRRE